MKNISRRTKNNIDWGSHLPVLMKVMSLTQGSVLELGSGAYSTPFLHWMCYSANRELLTYEDDIKFYNIFTKYENNYHKVVLVDDWDKIDIERQWDVVLVDHDDERRKIEIKRLASLAKYIVVHDTQLREERSYHFKEIYPLFKYIWKYRGAMPHTSILSNFVDLKDFKI